MAPFYGWSSTASRLEPLRGGSLLFTTKFPEILGTHLVDLGKAESTLEPPSGFEHETSGLVSSALTTRLISKSQIFLEVLLNLAGFQENFLVLRNKALFVMCPFYTPCFQWLKVNKSVYTANRAYRFCWHYMQY